VEVLFGAVGPEADEVDGPFVHDEDEFAAGALLEEHLPGDEVEAAGEAQVEGRFGGEVDHPVGQGTRRWSWVETTTMRPGRARSRRERITVSTWM